MTKKKSRNTQQEFIAALREVRLRLQELNQKLDHLIKSYRRFYFTTDFSDSSNPEFKC
jgi:hypothetical protein